jgi:hypothetical protein
MDCRTPPARGAPLGTPGAGLPPPLTTGTASKALSALRTPTAFAAKPRWPLSFSARPAAARLRAARLLRAARTRLLRAARARRGA